MRVMQSLFQFKNNVSLQLRDPNGIPTVYLIIIKTKKIMKTRSIYLVAFLLMTVVATFGSDEPKKAGVAVLPVKGEEVFKVIYKSETAGKVKVNLYNAKSEIIYLRGIWQHPGIYSSFEFQQA